MLTSALSLTKHLAAHRRRLLCDLAVGWLLQGALYAALSCCGVSPWFAVAGAKMVSWGVWVWQLTAR